jgi:CDP-glycerol glycerophosphotransferase (TagB/SpsB family)
VPHRVPGFTFTSGNAGKIFALPLYAFGALASVFVRRNHNLWVFGSAAGLAEGSLALYEFARTADEQRELVWLASTNRELSAARASGMSAALKSSARGLRLTLRAGVIAITHGFGDVNRFGTRGAYVVQLWHGIPLKYIALDSPATFRMRIGKNSRILRGMLRRAYRRTTANIDLLPASSELTAERLRKAFALPTRRVVVTGDPRDDVLFRGTDEARTAKARSTIVELLALTDRRRAQFVLYAPTWRDGEIDPGIPTESQWNLLADWLEESASVLLIRPHPHGVGDYARGAALSDRIRLFDSSIHSDITSVLPGFDMLITDYSSIAFDFALTGRPIAFLAPDLENYVATRGIYEPYAEFSGGTETHAWEQLAELLRRAGTDPGFASRLREHSVNLADRHHLFRDGRNTDRVYAEITSGLKENR